MDARTLVRELEAVGTEAGAASTRARLRSEEPVLGVRMGTLFEVAKRHRGLGLDDVHRLLDHPAYEVRLAGFCVLDFQARGRLDDEARAERYEVYLDRHDRITSWDMVDRAAPWVVGAHLAGRDLAPLHALAATDDPLRRRTAVTAPLWSARYGTDADVDGGLAVAEAVAADPDPVVHKAVGILLKHSAVRRPDAVAAFLDRHAASMARPAVRLAVEKLPPVLRRRW